MNKAPSLLVHMDKALYATIEIIVRSSSAFTILTRGLFCLALAVLVPLRAAPRLRVQPSHRCHKLTPTNAEDSATTAMSEGR